MRSGNFPQYLAKNRTLPEAAAASNVTEENRNGRNVFWGAFRMYFGLYSVLQGYCVLSYEVNYILTSEWSHGLVSGQILKSLWSQVCAAATTGWPKMGMCLSVQFSGHIVKGVKKIIRRQSKMSLCLSFHFFWALIICAVYRHWTQDISAPSDWSVPSCLHISAPVPKSPGTVRHWYWTVWSFIRHSFVMLQ